MQQDVFGPLVRRMLHAVQVLAYEAEPGHAQFEVRRELLKQHRRFRPLAVLEGGDNPVRAFPGFHVIHEMILVVNQPAGFEIAEIFRKQSRNEQRQIADVPVNGPFPV